MSFSIRRPRRLSPQVATGIALTLVAAFCFALAGFIASRLVGPHVQGTIVALLESLFGFVFVFGLRLGAQAKLPKSKRPLRAWSGGSLPWLALAAAGTALGVGGFYSALGYDGLSVVAPITGAVPLVSYVFILVFLRGEERLTKRVVLGATLVVIGVVLIGLSNG